MSNVKFAKHERRVAVGMEGTYGAVGAMGRYVPTEEVTLNYTREITVRDEFGVENTSSESYPRMASLEPKLTLPFNPDAVGEFLHSLTGTCQTTANEEGTNGTAYKHIFKIAGTVSDSLMSLTLKEDWGQGTAYDYFGVRVGNMTLSCAAKETVKMAFECVGQREVAGTTGPATLSYGTYRPFIFSDMTVNVDGTNLDGIYNIEININRNMSDGYRLGTQEYTTRPLPSRTNVGLKLTAEYEAVDRLRYLAGSTMYLSLTFASDQKIGGTSYPTCTIKIPKFRYTAAPFGYGDDNIRTVDIEGVALSGGTSPVGTSDSIIIELVNNVGSYTAY